MKLELATFPVKDIKFGSETSYADGILSINKDELIALMKEDARVASADVDIAFPGEQTRIVNVHDVVEPRVKVSGPGCIFPGVLGPVETVGEGRTNRLSEVAVVASVTYTTQIKSGTAAANSSIIDMWGPAAEATAFGSTINIVLVYSLAEGITELDAQDAILHAECKVARRLAETTLKLKPQSMETFELAEADSSLPRVVYIDSFLTNWHAPHSLVAFYGVPVRESLPTFIHPNEYLDGALTSDARIGSSEYTYAWGWMNKPVIFKLLREHGKTLNFLGVILQRTRFEAEQGKRLTAACTSQLARLLKADGAIITRTVASGANFVDVMMTVQACEQKGIKTLLLTPEWGGKGGTELPLVFYAPEATAIISTGSSDREFKLPSPEKVIGASKGEMIILYQGDAPLSPWGELTIDAHGITYGCDWWGGGNYSRAEY